MFPILAALVLACYALDVVTITASSHYDLGLQIGQQRKEHMHSFLSEYSKHMDVLRGWQSDPDTAPLYASIHAAQLQFFPHLFDELTGMANGADVPLIDLELLMYRAEISLYLRSRNSSFPVAEACSDVLSHRSDDSLSVLAHNEDGNPLYRNHSFLLRASIPSLKVSFSAYTYVCHLSGLATGWNQGIAMSLNALFPVILDWNGAARYFVARDIMEAHDASEVVYLLARNPIASGFSINFRNHVGSDLRQWQCETATQVIDCNFLATGADQFEFHANEYLRAMFVPQYPDPSSTHRVKTAYQLFEELTHLPDISDCLGILGDTSDSSYPIFRRPTHIDPDMTLATFAYQFGTTGKVAIYEDNPKLSDPVLTFDLG